MGCIAIIPARFHSVRFPGKALASLAGKPLIQHVAERCRQIEGVDRVIVATDDERIAEAARQAGAESIMTPSDLASGTDRVAHVAAGLETDVVLNVQGDEPLLDPIALGGALRQFIDSGASFGTLRAPLEEVADLWDPNVVKVVIDRSGRALYFSRAPIPFPRDSWRAGDNPRGRAEIRVNPNARLTDAYWLHVGVYIYRRTALARWARIAPSPLERLEGLEQLRILEAGESVHTFPIADSVPGVDTPEDLERVRRYVDTGSSAEG